GVGRSTIRSSARVSGTGTSAKVAGSTRSLAVGSGANGIRRALGWRDGSATGRAGRAAGASAVRQLAAGAGGAGGWGGGVGRRGRDKKGRVRSWVIGGTAVCGGCDKVGVLDCVGVPAKATDFYLAATRSERGIPPPELVAVGVSRDSEEFIEAHGSFSVRS